MRLNDIKGAEGSRRNGKRKGRGHSAGQGKTCGRGVKAQKSRSGGYHKVGFEGGQMPLQRRLPKVGFASRKARYAAEVRLHELATVEGDVAVPILISGPSGALLSQMIELLTVRSVELIQSIPPALLLAVLP